MRPLQTCRKFAFSQLLLAFRLFVGRGLDPSLPFCGYCQIPRRGGVTPPYEAIKNHCAVGAGHAPPAVLRLQQYNGSFVGAAYMPPVAITRALRYNGQTARNGQDRSLQTCRKYHIITEYCGNKIHHPVGAVIDRPRNFAATARFPGGVGSPRPTGQSN